MTNVRELLEKHGWNGYDMIVASKAALAAIEEAVLIEREECAKTCESAYRPRHEIQGTRLYFERCAEAIRARSDEKEINHVSK